jgi:hypothetical protein
MFEVFNGLGPHIPTLKAMQHRFDNKIILLKEEGDSSHCNQSYDNHATKCDKAVKTESLSMLCGTMLDISKAGVDQYGLIHVGLFAVFEMVPDTWTNSFRSCNMDPRCQVTFPEWCKKIEGFLQAGEHFKEEEPVSLYSFLSSMWHGMKPEEKEAMMAVIDLHSGSFSVDLCKALRHEWSIPFKYMHSMLTCYHLTKQFPIHLTTMAPTTNNMKQAESDDIAMSNAAVLGATSSLDSFLLKPDGLSGTDFFDHMVRKRLFDPTVMEHRPSSYLAIEFSEDQMEELGPGAKDLTTQRIMSFAGGHGATMKLSKRKLDNLEYIKAFTGVQNDPDRPRRLTNKLEPAQSLASITDAEANDAAAQKSAGEAND